MSEELSSHNNENPRPLSAREKGLTLCLVRKINGLVLPDGWLDKVLVSPMEDGKMGSLRFITLPSSKFSMQGSELVFVDSDGVEVIASLNIDNNGMPFELDIWKTNFNPLIEIPEYFENPKQGVSFRRSS